MHPSSYPLAQEWAPASSRMKRDGRPQAAKQSSVNNRARIKVNRLHRRGGCQDCIREFVRSGRDEVLVCKHERSSRTSEQQGGLTSMSSMVGVMLRRFLTLRSAG